MYIPYEWEKNIDGLRTIETGTSFSIMYSGGKDAGLALSMVTVQGQLNSILHSVDNMNCKSLFHSQSLNVIQEHARRLNVPIHYLTSEWWIRWDRVVSKYNELKKQGVQSIVFGDLCCRENVEIQYKLCCAAGMKACFPLYGRSYGEIVYELELRKIKGVISSINSEKIDVKWLGKVFDRDAYNEFLQLGIDPLGENGEYHTTVIGADFLGNDLKHSISKIGDKSIFVDVN